LGWVKKYLDMTFVGTSSSDAPLRNILDKNRLMASVEYSMRKSLDHSREVKFRIVEEVTPMISEAGMGLIVHSPFMKHLAVSLGFTPQDAFFMVLAAPTPGKRWGPEEIKVGTRIFEDPEDGQFHCNLNPSQWVMGVFNKSQPEIMHAVVEFDMIVPIVYLKVELERLGKEKEVELALLKPELEKQSRERGLDISKLLIEPSGEKLSSGFSISKMVAETKQELSEPVEEKKEEEKTEEPVEEKTETTQ
jgi:hypothetical protein